MPADNPVTRPNATVTQGPEWLAEFYLAPPPWLNPIIKIVGLLALLVVAWRLHEQDWSVDSETQLQMGRIAGTVVAVVTGVLAMANLTDHPYAVDVGVGFVVGYSVLLTVLSRPVRRRFQERYPDTPSRLATAWLLVAVLSLLLPALVTVRGAGISMFNGRLAVATVGVGMAALNLRQR